MGPIATAQAAAISTMNFSSCSQAGQDVFAYEMCGRKNNGTFLDIGSYNVVCCNNSYALERIGWRGILCDLFRDEENLPARNSPFVQADATSMNWPRTFRELYLELPVWDYLSVDIDENSLAALVNLPLATTSFSVITIEHDAYRLGNVMRDQIRSALNGYDLLCAGVQIEGKEFEDWFVNPGTVNIIASERVRSDGLEASEIVSRLRMKQ